MRENSGTTDTKFDDKFPSETESNLSCRLMLWIHEVIVGATIAAIVAPNRPNVIFGRFLRRPVGATVAPTQNSSNRRRDGCADPYDLYLSKRNPAHTMTEI
jgi:hypothetical protein